DGIILAQHPELEAARPRIDDQDPAVGIAVAYDDHAQFAISGASSPAMRVYARASMRLSTMSCRTWPARTRSPGTRSMTSITRWYLSRSLSMTMSNGVVVVPSSLYPRTCRFAWFWRR